MNETSILIVETELEVRSELVRQCEALGYPLTVAESVADARQKLSQQPFDLCITALSLADAPGYPFYEFCLKTYHHMQIILRCEIPEVMQAIQATREGVFAFFPWGHPKTAFIHLIKAALACEKRRSKTSWRNRLIHRSGIMKQVVNQIEHLTNSERPVHFTGPSGSGKRLCAELIHSASGRRDGAFISVDCRTQVPEQLSQQLFGHCAGAFEGASESETGALLQANGGVLFLHHIDAMPISVQLQLLAALHQNAVRPLGSERAYEIDFRLITSSDRSLESELHSRQFDAELFDLIYAHKICLPSLTQRLEDIPLLVKHRVERAAKRTSLTPTDFDCAAMHRLTQSAWPGNVRQLFKVVDNILGSHPGQRVITEEAVLSVLKNQPRALPTFTQAQAKFERDYLVQLMVLTDGNVTQAARLAECDCTDFYKLLHRYDLEPSSFKTGRHTQDTRTDIKMVSKDQKTG